MPQSPKQYPKPTAQVEPFVNVLGPDLAVRFLLRFGGAELDIPQSPRPDSMLSQCIGHDNAKAMAQLDIHSQRRVPLAKPWLSQYLRWQGMSVNEIARTVRASNVSVRGWLADKTTNLTAQVRKEDYLK